MPVMGAIVAIYAAGKAKKNCKKTIMHAAVFNDRP